MVHVLIAWIWHVRGCIPSTLPTFKANNLFVQAAPTPLVLIARVLMVLQVDGASIGIVEVPTGEDLDRLLAALNNGAEVRAVHCASACGWKRASLVDCGRSTFVFQGRC